MPSCRADLDDGAHGVLADAVAVQAREAALLGPAPVAVHDDGDVLRQACGIESPIITPP